jgi:tetratricopeptide (TPR) repeat protein
LETEPRVIRVVAGRENPCRPGNEKSWARASRCKIAESQVEAHLVGHLSPADAEESLLKAEIEDAELRASLIRYAQVAPGEPNEIHPFYLGLCADIVLAARRKNQTLTTADFERQPEIEDKERELIDRLLSYVDDFTREAVIALAACRAFNKKIFIELGKELGFRWENPAFDILRTFSFVWQAERRGEGWHRLHDLLRVLFADYELEKIRESHKVLENYYRQEAAKGDDIALAEAIYHANQLEWQRGVVEWVDVFQKNFELSRYEICRTMLDVRREIIIGDDFHLGWISQNEGNFYFFLSFYNSAKQEYNEAIIAYDKALKLVPDYVAAHNNKGLVLKNRGNLETALTRYEDALKSYQSSVESYDKALKLVPDDVYAHNNKGIVLQSRGDLEARLTRTEDALRSYQSSVESYDKALKLAPDYVYAHNNKGIVLQNRGILRLSLEQADEACHDLGAALAEYSRSLEIAPNDMNIQNWRQEVQDLIDNNCRET